jgi:hypothetical protein
MKAKTPYLVIGLISLVLMSCTGTHVQLSLRNYPTPVMVSPVLRVGDTAPPSVKLSEFSKFTGEASFSGAGASGSRKEGNYIIHETVSASESSNNVAYEINKATGGRSDLLVSVDTLRAGAWVHTSLVGFFNNWVSLEGRVLDPKPLQRR